jgi:hypothetical protein
VIRGIPILRPLTGLNPLREIAGNEGIAIFHRFPFLYIVDHNGHPFTGGSGVTPNKRYYRISG